jgi:hypothetical protein
MFIASCQIIFILIVTGESDSSELPGMVQAFKSLAARAVRKIGVFDLWQKGYYDHVLRGEPSKTSRPPRLPAPGLPGSKLMAALTSAIYLRPVPSSLF